ncbi:MAG: leucine-rich repeat domain-containing protein [Holosporales bacterium]|nr:leucine-rich repeat domain-containing protein [Holosporales bacterium]
MKKRKILEMVAAFALGALCGLLEAGAMFPEGPRGGFFPRERIAEKGVLVMLSKGTVATPRVAAFGPRYHFGVVPASVEALERGCFARCPLACIAFEEGSQLRKIGMYAFSNTSLRSICIPSSVTELGQGCFARCRSLSCVTFELGSRPQRVGYHAFSTTLSLECIYFPSKVVFEASVFDGSGVIKILVEDQLADPCSGAYAGTKALRSFIVLGDTEEIGDSCYAGCQSLKKVSFEEGSQLRRIGRHAFSNTSLRSIHIPSSVTELGQGCFAYCVFLTTVIFERGSRLSSIGSCVFCSAGLQTIHIPSSVTELDPHCFAGCKSLTTVIFEQGAKLSSIGSCVFYSSGLKTICIPSSVTELGQGCFAKCSSLTTVTFAADPQHVSIETGAFTDSPHVRIVSPDGRSLPAAQVWGMRVVSEG